MAPFSPRRCAFALLCAALVLAAACDHATGIVVDKDILENGKTFNDVSITLKLESASDTVTVRLLNSQVTGKGLTIHGYPSSIPTAIHAHIIMELTSTTVTESTIVMTGLFPSRSSIFLTATTGSLSAAQSLFDFSGLMLQDHVTVTVEGSSVTWPGESTNTGSIVVFNAGTTGAGISKQSSLFILNSTATNGASVLNVATGSALSITENSVLAVDYSHCNGCQSAMVSIRDSLTVTLSSMFRITYGSVAGSNKGLLSSAGSISVADKSLYLISDSIIESGALFNFGSAGFKFEVANSHVSFINLEGTSTGIESSNPIPIVTTKDTSAVLGGGCKIGDATLNTEDDYRSKGIKVTGVVNKDGARGNTCANAMCIPGSSKEDSHTVDGTKCTCFCMDTFNLPSCTATSDPTQTYDDTATCKVDNCATCSRLHPADQCSKCKPGYTLSKDFQCEVVESTTALCNVAYCVKCDSQDGAICIECRNGYKLTDSRCFANLNSAAALQSALLAAAVCAAAVYTL